MSAKRELLAKIDNRREATKYQANWYRVTYGEYRNLLDLLEDIVRVMDEDE